MVIPRTEGVESQHFNGYREGTVLEEMTRTARLLEDLHLNGITYQSIADDLGVDRRTILRWYKSETHPTPQILTNNYLENRLQMLLAMQDLGVQAAKKLAEQKLEAAATSLE